MRSYLEDEAARILVEFTEGGEPFIASAATWSLRGQDGALLSGPNTITLGLADVQTSIVISASLNTVLDGLEFEKRTLIVEATNAATTQVWTRRVAYRVLPWLNHSVTPDSVRALAGLDVQNLPDEDIDVFSAYLWLKSMLPDGGLNSALINGGRTEVLANKALEARAVLDAIPSIANRMLKKRADGSIQAERFTFDPTLLQGLMQRHIDEAIEAINPVAAEAVVNYSFGIPTDPVTGG